MIPPSQAAFDELRTIGTPVLSPDLGWGGEFAISAELYGENDGFYDGHIDHDPSGNTWADYNDFNYGEFGVSKYIVNILNKHDMFCEWINPGVLAVYYN